jgi:hypothetical protein
MAKKPPNQIDFLHLEDTKACGEAGMCLMWLGFIFEGLTAMRKIQAVPPEEIHISHDQGPGKPRRVVHSIEEKREAHLRGVTLLAGSIGNTVEQLFRQTIALQRCDYGVFRRRAALYRPGEHVPAVHNDTADSYLELIANFSCSTMQEFGIYMPRPGGTPWNAEQEADEVGRQMGGFRLDAVRWVSLAMERLPNLEGAILTLGVQYRRETALLNAASGATGSAAVLPAARKPERSRPKKWNPGGLTALERRTCDLLEQFGANRSRVAEELDVDPSVVFERIPRIVKKLSAMGQKIPPYLEPRQTGAGRRRTRRLPHDTRGQIQVTDSGRPVMNPKVVRPG